MTNEEYIEEMLHEAAELNIREDVLKLAKTLRDTNERMTLVDAIELALKHYKNH